MASQIFDKVLIPFPFGRLKHFLALGATLLAAGSSFAAMQSAAPVPDIFKTVSTPADAIRRLSFFVLTITGLIFAVVFSLLVYAVWKYRHRGADDNREPPQVYGSNQVELAWTVVPVLIVLVLFFATARVIQSVQDAIPPPGAMQVTADWPSILVGIPLSYPWRRHRQRTARSGQRPRESHADFRQTSFRRHRPQLLGAALAGKTDLIPNRINSIWIDPHETGMFVGQCAQYCGTQHAKMLLRVYVDSPEQFAAWVSAQKQPASVSDSVAAGRKIFETTACINCHKISGTIANGRFGPDLTHLMSRDTIASGRRPIPAKI